MRTMQQRHAETGFVLLTTVMLLALVTVVVFSAMRTSAIEAQISANELIHQKIFFLAEAGIEHAVNTLVPLFEQENAVHMHAGQLPSWDFAFGGPDRIVGTADDARGNDGQPGSFERGSKWLDVRHPDGTWYTVTLWNNTESETGGDYDTDDDGLVWIRSVAGSPRGGRASIQVLLQAAAEAPQPSGYPTQAGGGAAGTNSGVDLEPMVDFNLQMEPD